MNFELYRSRLMASGDSINESMKQDTINTINELFANSPSYKEINIGYSSVDVRLSSTDKSDVRVIYFRPQEIYYVGDYAEMEDGFWIISEFDNNELYPKALIQKCNHVIKWKDSQDNLFSFNCIATSEDFNVTEHKYISLTNGEARVFVQYNTSTKNIVLQQRFIFNGSVFEVVGIDKLTKVVSENGIINLIMRLTISNDKDDFTNSIADNSVIYHKGDSNSSSSGGSSLW